MEQKHMPFSLWIINPVILNYKKRYIYGTNLKSSRIFFMFLSERIGIDGFIDEELKHGKIWNKSVYGIEHVQDDENALLILLGEENVPRGDYCVCKDILVPNSRLAGKQIYIYGAGNVGEFLLRKLGYYGIDIVGFIDSDRKKQGKYFLNCKVWGKEILQDLSADDAVIEAGKFYREIDAGICEVQPDIKRFYCVYENDCKPKLTECIVIDAKKNVYMRPYTLLQFAENSWNQKIILWGDDSALASQYCEVLELMGFSNLCIISNEQSAVETKYGQISSIEDVLYESDYFILLYGHITTRYVNTLERLGFVQGKDYVLLDYPVAACKMGGRKQILDINLGYAYEMNCRYPGFYILGTEKPENFRIVILGGSTSDSDLYRYQSWPEIFYKEYCQGNITIFNGAQAGYNSVQELMKLMRDAVHLKPDLIIVLDGINDIASCGSSGRNLFGFSYMSTVLNKLIEKNTLDQYVLPMELEGGVKIWKGVEDGKITSVEEWKKNIQYMQSVAEINSIKFHAFLQPMLLGKKRAVSLHEASLMKMDEAAMGDWFGEQCRIFRQCGEKLGNEYAFFHDLSKVFDNEDVYMDECHVYERGNAIIAKAVYECIKGDLPG